MNEMQQVLEGGVGAMTFYILFQSVNIIKDMISKKPKNGLCSEHGVMCAHLESIRETVGETKHNVDQLIRDVAEVRGRIEA
jgi:hypothetical protein